MERLLPNTRTLCLTLLFGVIFFNSSAQFGLAVGPKAGIGVTTLKGSSAENIEKRTSFLFGAFLNAQFTPGFALQPEILLTQRGADFTNNNTRTELIINYFDVPVLAKVRLPIADLIFPHILIGPDFAFRTKLDYTSMDTQSGAVITTNENDIRKSDVGGLVGAGLDVEARNVGLFFTADARYGFGFNNLDRSDNSIRIRNAGWTFAVGVGFLLKSN
jgi:hypothetical protein